MRYVLTLFCLAALVMGPNPATAVETPPPPHITLAGEDNFEPPRDDISPAEEQAAWDEIQRNIARLRAAGALAAPQTAQVVNYDWPVRLAPGLTDYAGFYVSGFSDHNPASGQLQDYNNGARTYDSGTYNHQGTDIALWPFSWNKVDAGEMWVVAAAAGTIVANNNVTSTDHNCGSGSGSFGNWIALLHGDGRVTIYGHMRYNSLTNKAINDSVAAGEYLGTVASSGSSTGPHVHFEVRAANGSSVWIDPYTGPANPIATSWNSQRSYYDSAINKLATGTALPVFPACQPAVTNIQNSFMLTAATRIYFHVYYRDYQGALPTLLNIYDPNSNIFQTWSYTDNTTFASIAGRYWYFDFPANSTPGAWRFQALYNGQTYETSFNVNAPPTLTVSSPNGGEQWDILFSHPITWTDNFGNDVSISLYHSGTLAATLTSATPSNGWYDWVPGFAFPPGPGYTIRVASVLSSAVYDESDAPFALLPTVLTNTLYLPNVMR